MRYALNMDTFLVDSIAQNIRIKNPVGAAQTAELAMETLKGLFDALEVAHDEFHAYIDATTPAMQAGALIKLCNKMSDLATWHPEYDLESGRIRIGSFNS